MEFGGAVLKPLFETAIFSDIRVYELHEVFNELQSCQTGIIHFIPKPVTNM